ncbi:MAG: type I-E CRISPR-associated protein Cse1/CasA [Opitutales bacterium]
MNNINLVRDKWIKVKSKHSNLQYCSLREIFTCGEDIEDLDMLPIERISIMRLLICIVQSSIRGPENLLELKFFKTQEGKLSLKENILEYLAKWEDRFNLFDEKYPFLQNPHISSSNLSDLATMDFEMPSGNNSQFLISSNLAYKYSLKDIVIKLLVFQNYVPSGRGSIATWVDKSSSPQVTGAICRGALAMFVLKENLWDSILANIIDVESLKNGNLVSVQELGTASWEKSYDEVEDFIIASKTFVSTYLARLVPLSRAIKIDENLDGLYCGEFISYTKDFQFRDSIFKYYINKDSQISRVKANSKKAIWRILPALLESDLDNGKFPLYALKNTGTKETYSLWVGGIETDQAKNLMDMESSFVFSSYTSEDAVFAVAISVYKDLLGLSDIYLSNLKKAISAYYKALNGSNSSAKETDLFYWTSLEEQKDIILKLFAVSSEEERSKIKEDWENLTLSTALDVYTQICQKETDRQLKAFISNKSKIFKKGKK